MSNEAAPYGIARRVVDGDWSVRAAVEPGPPIHYTVVVEEAGTIVKLPLTARRARALIRELTYMLEDTGERTKEAAIPWSEIRHKGKPLVEPIE